MNTKDTVPPISPRHEWTGKLIRDIRLAHNIKPQELCNILKISVSFLLLVERGQRGIAIEKAMIFCSLFDISLDYLYGFSQSSSNNNNHRYKQIEVILESFTDDDLLLLCNILRVIMANKKNINTVN